MRASVGAGLMTPAASASGEPIAEPVGARHPPTRKTQARNEPQLALGAIPLAM